MVELLLLLLAVWLQILLALIAFEYLLLMFLLGLHDHNDICCTIHCCNVNRNLSLVSIVLISFLLSISIHIGLCSNFRGLLATFFTLTEVLILFHDNNHLALRRET